MVGFIPVAPEDVPNFREGRRGRVSYPILKSFLETGLPVAQLDRTGMQNSTQSLMMCLSGYCRSHDDIPVKIFMRSGQIYLARTDVDEYGNELTRPSTGQTEGHEPTEGHLAPTGITPEEVRQRFEEEKNQVTK